MCYWRFTMECETLHLKAHHSHSRTRSNTFRVCIWHFANSIKHGVSWSILLRFHTSFGSLGLITLHLSFVGYQHSDEYYAGIMSIMESAVEWRFANKPEWNGGSLFKWLGKSRHSLHACICLSIHHSLFFRTGSPILMSDGSIESSCSVYVPFLKCCKTAGSVQIGLL